MKRITCLVALVGTVAVTSPALAGCGAGSRTPARLATKTRCEFTKPSKRTAINVLAYNSTAIDPFTNTMIASCSHDRVVVKHDPVDFAGQVQKTRATLGGQQGTYDIIETYGFIIPGLAAKGQLEPLDQYFAKYKGEYALDGLDKAMVQRMSYDGKLYALPMQAQAETLVYRKDVFDKLGLTAPTTFDEMMADAKKIQAAGVMEHPIALPWLSSADLGTAYVAMLGAYGKPYVDRATKRPNLDTPESEQALQKMKDLLAYMDPQVTTFDQPKVQQQLYNGRAAMAILFSGRLNDLRQSSNSKYADDFAFAPSPTAVPGGKGYQQVSIDGWSIPRNAKVDKDLLFRVMASSVSDPVSRGAVPAAYPARTSSIDPSKMPFASAITKSIAAAPPAQPYAWVADISNTTRPVVGKVMSGQVSVEEGAREMQALAEQVMKKY